MRLIIIQLKWGERHLIKIESIKTRTLQIAVGNVTNTLIVADVYYVLGFINILSYMRMRDKGMLFEDDGKQLKLRFKDEDDTVAYVNIPAKGEKGLLFLLLRTSRTYITLANLAAVSETTWHRRFGHINNSYVIKALKIVNSIHITDKDHPASCHSCLTAK
jgi:GAG-pre-integrase domain